MTRRASTVGAGNPRRPLRTPFRVRYRTLANPVLRRCPCTSPVEASSSSPRPGSAPRTVGALGFSAERAVADVRLFKLAHASETRNTCPYCSVGCGVILYGLGDRSKNARTEIMHVEGDPDHPVNRGTLCPKGASLLDFIHSPTRLKFPEYRAPGSSEWKRVSWEWAVDRVARLMKEDRDKNFVDEERQGTDREPVDEHGVPGRLGLLERDRLRVPQGDPGARGGRRRQPGACLTRPHGGRSGPDVRPWRDDEQLGRHQERRPDPGDGRQPRRGPSLRLQVGARGQGQEEGPPRRRRPALHPDRGGGRSLRPHPARDRHRLPGRRHPVPARERQDPARLRQELHERRPAGARGHRLRRRPLHRLRRGQAVIRQDHLELPGRQGRHTPRSTRRCRIRTASSSG